MNLIRAIKVYFLQSSDFPAQSKNSIKLHALFLLVLIQKQGVEFVTIPNSSLTVSKPRKA